MRSVKITDYMAEKLVTLQPHTNVVEAMGILLANSISGAPVVNDNGELVGMISEVDVMRVVVQDSYYDESAGVVGDYMHSPVDTVSADMDIYQVAQRFISEGRRRYPVVSSSGALIGQISRRDVLRVAQKFLMHEKA